MTLMEGFLILCQNHGSIALGQERFWWQLENQSMKATCFHSTHWQYLQNSAQKPLGVRTGYSFNLYQVLFFLSLSLSSLPFNYPELEHKNVPLSYLISLISLLYLHYCLTYYDLHGKRERAWLQITLVLCILSEYFVDIILPASIICPRG